MTDTGTITHSAPTWRICLWCLAARLVLLLSAAIGCGLVALGVGVFL